MRTATPFGRGENVTIFISERDFKLLNRAIPVGSPSKQILAVAPHITGAADSAGNYAITCTEAEARNLLLYARQKCPGAAAAIVAELRLAGFARDLLGN